MGYESRLIVAEPSSIFRNLDGHSYARVIATIDLCGMPCYFRDLLNDHWHDSGCYIYVGDEEVATDYYGSPLVATDLATAIADLRATDQRIIETEGERYRRIPPALGLLEGIDQSQWSNLLVMHFGY